MGGDILRNFFLNFSLPLIIFISAASFSSASGKLESSRGGGRCSIFFKKEIQQDFENRLGEPSFNVIGLWRCEGHPDVIFDKYLINGDSPRVVSQFFVGSENFFVIVRWRINSRAADISGDYYEVYAYSYRIAPNGYFISRNESEMSAFPPGMDGVRKDGASIIYPFKSSAEILKKLNEKSTAH